MKVFLAGLCAIVAVGLGATSLIYWQTRTVRGSGELATAGSAPVALAPSPHQEPPAVAPPWTPAQPPAPVPATALEASPAAPPEGARVSRREAGDPARSPGATTPRPLHRGKWKLDERTARLAVQARQPR